MKKILLTIMAVVFIFSLSAPVMAKGLKPPKNICFETNSDPSFVLGIKKGNKIVISDVKLSMYTIQGIYIEVPISGTGYISNDDFVFQVSTSANVNVMVLGLWDLVTETGTATVNVTDTGSFSSTLYDLYLCGNAP